MLALEGEEDQTAGKTPRHQVMLLRCLSKQTNASHDAQILVYATYVLLRS
jgi:hypothetical protein